MNVIVTGGAGFIGSHLVDALLLAGHDVVVVDDFSHGRESNLAEAKIHAQSHGRNLKIHRASLLDPSFWASLDSCEAFFHIASQNSVIESIQNPEHDFRTNVDPIPYILKYIRSKKVKYLIHASSGGTVYGNAPYFPTDERALVRPLSPYGATKAFFEIYVSSWTATHKQKGDLSNDPKSENYFSWVALRLGNVFGPRQQPDSETSIVPTFIEELSRGQVPKIFGDGSKTRDYIYISDVINGFMRAYEELQKLPLDDVFNIGSAKETKDQDVFNVVLAAIKKKYPSLKIDKPQHLPSRPGEVIRSLLDINKACAHLSWDPKVTFDQGVEKTVEFFFQGQKP